MTTLFQYTTLAHQTAAVQPIADVFADVRFVSPANVHCNPTMVPGEAVATLKQNIADIRARNRVHAGDVQVSALPLSLCGIEAHAITNAEVQARSLYLDPFMPADSGIERETIDESNQTSITIFAKLPKIDIPTPAGKYNPDFGYAIASEGCAQALYLVIETKG